MGLGKKNLRMGKSMMVNMYQENDRETESLFIKMEISMKGNG